MFASISAWRVPSALTLAICAGGIPKAAMAPPGPLQAPPAELRAALQLAPFYRKHLALGDFAILGSSRVPDAALQAAHDIAAGMLERRPDLVQALARLRIRMAVMAHDENTVDIPEHADLKPADYWNQRSRGLGPTLVRPAVSCAEENLLGLPNDRYQGESICVHEFAHAIELALHAVEPRFKAALEHSYQEALKAGRWKDTYAATNASEYWAEAVQSYFDANQQPDASHNDVHTREQLARHDPAVHGLIERTLRAPKWRLARSR